MDPTFVASLLSGTLASYGISRVDKNSKTDPPKMKKLLLLLLLAAPVSAQTVTPQFTQGSMQSTTTTTIDIERTIETEVFGGDYNSWSGSNVTPSCRY